MAQGLRQGCVLSPLLFNVFFAAILFVVLDRFSKDAGILANLIHLQEQPSKVGPETALECDQRPIWGMLYADNAGIVSRSPRGLGRMMAVFVEVFGTFGLTISESKMETMCMPTPRAPATKIVFNATGQVPPDNLLRLLGRHCEYNLKPVSRDRPADPRGVDGLSSVTSENCTTVRRQACFPLKPGW